MINKILSFIKQINCDHVDTRKRITNKKYRYVDICNKCRAKRYVK